MNDVPTATATVVIATADRPAMVLDCVRRFAEQVPAGVEVLVVDAGRDAPVEIGTLAGIWQNSRVVRWQQRNAGLQRNEGVRLAKHETVVFLDDDCFVQAGWWPGIIEPLTNPAWLQGGADVRSVRCTIPPVFHASRQSRGIAAVAGGVWVNRAPKLVDRPGGYVNAFGEPVQITHRGAGAPRFVDWPLTTNMAVRRDVFMEVGGFAAVYGIYDEDVDLGLKIRRAGWRIAFQPESAVYHYFMERGRKPVTKRSEFLAGRNRSILLVRNYGMSHRLLLFLLTAPWVKLGGALLRIGRAVISGLGHAASYVAGMAAGVVAGLKNPIDSDTV